MAKKKSKVERNRKVRNINKSPWKTYERVWAENGVVNIEGKDGVVSNLTPRDAALRCKAINDMMGSPKLPDWERSKALKFIGELIPIIKEARRQLEDPSNQNETIVSNVLGGLSAEGKELKPLTDPDEMLRRVMLKYPMLTYSEITTVLNEKKLPLSERMNTIGQINGDRLMAIVNQHNQAKAQR